MKNQFSGSLKTKYESFIIISKNRLIIFFLFNLLLFTTIVNGDSGGVLSSHQAAYDVTFYDLDLTINIVKKTISGSLLVEAVLLKNIDTLVLDLSDNFSIDSVLFRNESNGLVKAPFIHSSDKIFIDIPKNGSLGNKIQSQIFYHGSPRSSSNPPWDSGFVWEKTSAGKDWVGVACEDEGGDIWWPCKDHPSDEPDSMVLHFTVPSEYICVSNGRLISHIDNNNETTTFNWFVSTPINNYNVTLYISDFELIEDVYGSINGDNIPFKFWVLPESYTDAQNHLPIFLSEFQFLESICGPFPFGMDKHGWAHSPYWGMEHQTIIAYGNDFKVNNWGMDYIHFHELAHEWWGNVITASDWSDIWIHEGLATYMEALYVENLAGINECFRYMDRIKPQDFHEFPLAPIVSVTAQDAFGDLNSYHRGAWVMHTLRYHIGDDNFFNLLKNWAYPGNYTNNENGRLCRILNTDEMKQIAEETTGIELDPFFNIFFREASYPYLQIDRFQNETKFKWISENKVLLDVNIPVKTNNIMKTVEMISGQGSISLPLSDEITIDPENWILMGDPIASVGIDNHISQIPDNFHLYQNYPNPFNPGTTIKFNLPINSMIEVFVSNLKGEIVTELYTGEKMAGVHILNWNANNFPSGIYFINLRAKNYHKTIKSILIK